MIIYIHLEPNLKINFMNFSKESTLLLKYFCKFDAYLNPTFITL